MVLLGTPTAESSKLYAMTVTEGDPTWAGPLAGEALRLPVYHVTENEVKELADDDVYESEVGMVEMVIEIEDIAAAVSEVRTNNHA